MKTLLRSLAVLLAAAALVYLVLCMGVWTGQRRLLFHPDANPLREAPAAAETLRLQTADGERLQAWWLAPPNEQAAVLLYLHGNGANLDARSPRLAALHEDGFGVLALSWRGYGGSSGEPSEAGWREDARAGYAELKRRGIAPARIVLFGESLGSAQAVMLAAEQPVAGLLLDSGFDSALAIARGLYPWLPVDWLMRDPHRADRAAAQVAVPVLQLHCEQDPVTPVAHARALQKAFRGPARLELLPGNCHVPRYVEFRPLARAFVQSLVKAAAPGG
ncbi:alpha/beta hydrolase [Inhella proteolytica]|uniref:Alpha/beta fold hydrolase n=1 Tax=Inhella proteolytica TaxID=2795029 RepID=A0A931J399_9BURK|nr:alpha/beta fold hydrolase [Inhella proteolytica]MBH9577511.1 alpha/beta fold hydrolase [Inhella proteolytica]